MASDGTDPRALLGNFSTALWLPVYPALVRGPWEIRTIMMAAARGYWGEVYRITGTTVLSGPGAQGPAAWMAITPSEIESQEIGLARVRGHTVVLGLGMGWLAANAALKHEVTHVTVVERDPDIIALVEAAGVFTQLPETMRDKVEIVVGDAHEWRPSGAVDSLQADIWEHFVEPGKRAAIRRMQDNIGAASVYFWGQEMEIWRGACARGIVRLDEALIRTIIEQDIGVPLIVPDWPDYQAKIEAAAAWWAPSKPGWWREA